MLTCTRGLEGVSELEIKELGLRTLEKMHGKILVEGGKREAVLVNFAARTVNKVFLVLKIGEIDGIEDVYRIARQVEWEEYLSRDMSFGVEARRVGMQGFTSMEVAREVGQAVIDRVVAEAGFRPRVYLRDPDLRVYAEANRGRLFLAIDTTGESLHMRHYRVYQHPAPIQPTLAAALLFIAEKPRSLVDPFCGSGTVVIEAARMLRNIPQSRSFAFQRLPAFDGLLEEVKVGWKTGTGVYELNGFDISRKHVEGAKRNAESAGVADTVRFWVGSATKRESYPQDVSTIVTNPPYGLRIASKRVIERLYDDFARIVAELGAELTLITGEPYFLKAAEKAGLELVERYNIMYGALPSLVLRYR